MRPDVLLFGEEHPDSDTLETLISDDLKKKLDLLLIIGTSLKVDGIKSLVKKFAKAVRSNKGSIVFVNKTEATKSVWSNILGYWVEGDCDTWVRDLEKRTKTLSWSRTAA